MPDVPGMTHRWSEGGVLVIVFDRPGEKVNLLTPEILQGLDRMLDDVQGHPDLRAVMFTSGKPGMFIAGMDVEQIGAVQDSHMGADASRFGQSIFQKIADLGVPSACVIGGTCLGGGTELALGCSFRVAADDPQVKIGLPEVKLGIIPGFGGSQRLPRLVGLTAALDLIVAGRTIDARKARKIGLVDLVVPPAYLEREARTLLLRAAEDGVGPVVASVRKKRPLVSRLIDRAAPLRNFVIGQARKRTESKVDPEHYPAPFKAIEAIDAAMTQPLPAGLDLEARILGELVPNRTTKSLIWLFQSQNALKKQRPDQGAVPRKVRRMAVLGAGIMGGGIAQLAADRGIAVRLKDLEYGPILTALKTADGLWRRQVKRKRISKGEMARKMALISPTLTDSGMTRIDLVIEAVVEKLEVKQQVLAALEQRMSDRAVFATNTSSLPITEIASRALYPERVVGMHFFNPVHRMPLVEVIAGRRSSPEALATVHALAVRMGKVPVLVKDGPGFLVNRILTFYINEAARLLTEGIRIEAADKAMTAFGMPMGPFELLDQVGLDTAHHVGGILRDGLGERAATDSNLLDTLIGSGRLGKKSERGLYRYRNGKRTVPDGEVYGMIGSPPPRDLPPETLQERMVLSMINEAAYCLEEGVVREPRDVDLAMVMGTGFPPFRGGLLRHADSVGIPIIADRLSRLADAHGERFRPAQLLQTMVREQRRFYG